MLLVTIHDVTPAWAAEVSTLWHLCRARGVLPGLLVVPQWHGKTAMERDADFIAWLREAQRAGAEIFLHGERHDEVDLPRTFMDECRAWGRTAREGEFLTLDRAAAAARIARGLARFAALGLHPIGFVPPAWLAREEGFAAAADAGLAVSEDDTGIRLLQEGRRLASPVVRWSGRGAVRAQGSALVASARWTLQRHAPIVRVALHPGDLRHRACVASITRELDRWVSLRTPGHYRELLAAE
jgi:predicted deacetylase